MKLPTFKKGLRALALGAALAFSLPAEKAEAVPATALELVIDGSGSISSGDFTLQQTAYVAAVTNLIPIDGSIAVGVIQFGNDTVQTEFGLTIIASLADKNNLIAALNAMVQLDGNTPTGPAIQAATQALLALPGGADRLVIDVSTDGENNSGISDTQAALDAITAGVNQVNCLGVGANAVCDFETGTGSFQILAPNFAAFQTAIEQKIRTETNQIPEPTTLALLGAGLLGLGLARRRRS